MLKISFIVPVILLGMSACSKDHQAYGPIMPEILPVVAEPTATPAPTAFPTPTTTPTMTTTPSPTPSATPTPNGTPYLIQRKSVKIEVSPKGTFGFDLRKWLSKAIIT